MTMLNILMLYNDQYLAQLVETILLIMSDIKTHM